MLSQAVYWSLRCGESGEFYKSRDEWQDETGLTHEQQESARERLRKKGFWKERRDCLSHRVFYALDATALGTALKECLSEKAVSENRKRRFSSTGKDGSPKPGNTVLSNHAETTAETTIEPAPLMQMPEQPDHTGTAAKIFANHWNSLLPHLPGIKTMSPGRARALRQRLKEPWWRDNWNSGLKRMAGSDFLAGKGQKGDKPWKATVDWFLKPDTLAKIIEGKYDNAPDAEKKKFWEDHI